MFLYVVGGAAGALVTWYAVASAWAASIAKHRPELRQTVLQVRYGWQCGRCGHTHTPVCKAGNCGGPLVWVQNGTRIKCARCHRYFIPHPMLFRQTPRPRRMLCTRCKWIGTIKEWKVG